MLLKFSLLLILLNASSTSSCAKNELEQMLNTGYIQERKQVRKMINLKKTIILFSLIISMTIALMPLSIVRGDQTLFKVTIIAPGNANIVRRQWGQIFANSLRLLGIDARLVFLGWTSVYDRVLTPPRDKVGKIWDQGGYDMELIGYTPGLLPEPRQLFYGGEGFFAPDGQNYQLWNDTRSNALLDQFITATNAAVQDQALEAWQSLYYDEMPSSQIVYEANPVVVNPRIQGLTTTPNGEGWVYFNVQPTPEYLKVGSTSKSVVYASTSEIESLIPPLSNSWYDTIIDAVLFNGLAQTAPDLSDLTSPALLQSWQSSSDGFNWTYNLRPDVKWHDNVTFTADDVLFSLWALMNPDTGSQFVGYYKSVYGDNVTFQWENGTSTTLGSGSRLGTIKAENPLKVTFNLPVLANGKPYGYFSPYLLTFANNIIPKHIFEKIPPAQWTDSCFNTGQGSTTIDGKTYTGPIGTGPYKWAGYDPVAQQVHLQKFENYWNKTALEAEGLYQVTDYYVKFIADKTSALAALKTGEVDMLDYNYQLQTDVSTIDPSWGRVIPLKGTGRQEIGYNMQHPIYGTGVNTPLAQANASRAAEAARYVRIAFDYAVPRQLIIDNLLAGTGDPAATPMLPSQPFYNTSITARPYDLAKAKEYLEKAGYTVPGLPTTPTLPSFILGMSAALSGVYEDADGNPIPKRDLELRVTNDNSTYSTTATIVSGTTTDLTGFYSFTATPTTNGTYYYYLFDRLEVAGSEWKYLTMLNVSSIDDAFAPLNNKVDALQNSLNNMTYVAVAALAVAIIVGVVAIYRTRPLQKKKS